QWVRKHSRSTVLKSAVRTFDQKTIALGSTRSYKCSNHLQVDSKCNENVPRECVYDAEMYRILHNWLAKVHRFEITSQWHLEGIGNDGDWHHLYCDLTIKKPDNPYPEVILELQATGSIPTLIKHFNRAITYADQLRSREI
ncbi:22405_t:CDS:1, partial [Gigaspora margarita]